MANLSITPNPDVTFKVHYEDEHVVVVEKAAHLVTQPGLGHEDDSLLNGLFARWGNKLQNLGKDRDFGLLHRLDRETSGLLVVALTKSAYDAIREQFAHRGIRKYYWAVSAGRPRGVSGVIRKPILEHESRSKKLAKVSPAGKPAVTAYRVLQTGNLGTLFECRAVTGRLHQIRVHLASIGCAILGDGFYGRDSGGPRTRLALHAHRIVFAHPVSGAALDIRTGWPADLRRVLKTLGLLNPRTTPASPGASSTGSAKRSAGPTPPAPDDASGDAFEPDTSPDADLDITLDDEPHADDDGTSEE